MPEQKKSTKEDIAELQFVIFGLGNEEFGIEISQVREIIRLQNITPVPQSPDFIEGVINLRGQIIAVMDLTKRFSISKGKSSDKSRIVVAEVKGKTMGLIVDEVPEVVRISSANIEPTPEMIGSKIHSEFIKGVGKVGKRLIIILDVDKILTHDEVKLV